jgi:hypothetical protein
LSFRLITRPLSLSRLSSHPHAPPMVRPYRPPAVLHVSYYFYAPTSQEYCRCTCWGKHPPGPICFFLTYLSKVHCYFICLVAMHSVDNWVTYWFFFSLRMSETCLRRLYVLLDTNLNTGYLSLIVRPIESIRSEIDPLTTGWLLNGFVSLFYRHERSAVIHGCSV